MAEERNGKRGTVFEFVILHHPKSKKKDAARPKSRVVVDLERVIAKDQQEAVIVAARRIPENLMSELEDVEILVRPF